MVQCSVLARVEFYRKLEPGRYVTGHGGNATVRVRVQ
jgi:hypothetical protein